MQRQNVHSNFDLKISHIFPDGRLPAGCQLANAWCLPVVSFLIPCLPVCKEVQRQQWCQSLEMHFVSLKPYTYMWLLISTGMIIYIICIPAKRSSSNGCRRLQVNKYNPRAYVARNLSRDHCSASRSDVSSPWATNGKLLQRKKMHAYLLTHTGHHHLSQ